LMLLPTKILPSCITDWLMAGSGSELGNAATHHVAIASWHERVGFANISCMADLGKTMDAQAKMITHRAEATRKAATCD